MEHIAPPNECPVVNILTEFGWVAPKKSVAKYLIVSMIVCIISVVGLNIPYKNCSGIP
jgi:hypothetical protein